MSARGRGLILRYEALVAEGALQRDDTQRAAVERLQALSDALEGRRAKTAGFLGALSAAFRKQDLAPRGAYLFGPVGRGKTFLMDLFFDALPIEKKRRAHFHAFMADAHDRLHRLRRNPRECESDPIGCVAREIARETRLLCFDEFAVHDIADATILARLFSALFAAGVVVVATSNVEPARLYEGGRNRDLFLPFIALLKEKMDILRLAAPIDYRSRPSGLGDVYFAPADARAREAINLLFLKLTGLARGAPAAIEVKRRKIEIPQAAERVARFSFAELCGRALAPADYLALAQCFDAVIVEDIPILAPERRNEARRLITLVDALYEARALLILSAAGEPDELYRAQEGAEAREFERAASRLVEMRGKAYVEENALKVAPCTP